MNEQFRSSIERSKNILSFDEKTARNKRVQKRFDELQAKGEHGLYETIFCIVHEECELTARK